MARKAEFPFHRFCAGRAEMPKKRLKFQILKNKLIRFCCRGIGECKKG